MTTGSHQFGFKHILRVFLGGSIPAKYLRDYPFIEKLADSSFSIFRVSKLLNFSFNTMYLSRISHQLDSEIEKIHFGAISEITVMCPPPVMPCIKITVSSKKKKLYEALMLSIDNITPGDTIWLPFYCVLLEGKTKIAAAVTHFLERTFLCQIRDYIPRQLDFFRMIGLAFQNSMLTTTLDDINVSWGFKDMAKITLSMNDEAATAFWSYCAGDVSDDGLSEILAEEFMQEVCNYFQRLYGVNLNHMTLHSGEVGGVTINMVNTLELRGCSICLSFLFMTYLNLVCKVTRC